MEKFISKDLGVEVTVSAISGAEKRMETLKQSGVDMSKFFVLKTPDGKDVPVTIGENGQIQIAAIKNATDAIEAMIRNHGFTHDNVIDGRWVTAQTFRLLGDDENWTGRFYKTYKTKFMFEYLLGTDRRRGILDTIISMERSGDTHEAEIRKNFFGTQLVYELLSWYVSLYCDYVAKMNPTEPRYACKIGYVKRENYEQARNMFESQLKRLSYNKDNIKLAKEILKNVVEHPLYVSSEILVREKYGYKCPEPKRFCQRWIDGFKGQGAYLTLRNLVKFHNCCIFDEEDKKLDTRESLQFLDKKVEEWNGEYFRMLALLKKTIRMNDFKWSEVKKNLKKAA